MKCDLCDNEATVFLTEIVDGKMRKINLCESCAKENEVEDPTGFALADVLLGMNKKPEGSSEAAKCPECGFTRSDLEKTGRLGCSVCYETFGDEIVRMLQRLHKGLIHTGKKIEAQVTARIVQNREQNENGGQETEEEARAAEEMVEAAKQDDKPKLQGQVENQPTDDLSMPDEDMADHLDIPEPEEEEDSAAAEEAQITEQLGSLREDLQRAISDEEYEEAAKLRDEIRNLENQLK